MQTRVRQYRQNTVIAVAALATTVLTACVSPNPPLYRWGEYESILYDGYRNGGSDPLNDAVRLAEDMARTEAEGMQIPPGARVQLAYMYYSQGRHDEARALLEEERDVFPESATFVNGLLTRM